MLIPFDLFRDVERLLAGPRPDDAGGRGGQVSELARRR